MRRKFLSVVLCVCMMLTMAPFAFAAGETTESATTNQSSNSSGSGSETVTPTAGITTEDALRTAITKAATAENKIVTLDGDIDLTSQLTINTSITLNGNGHTIKANNTSWSTDNSSKHLVSIEGTNKVTLNNVILDSNDKAYGVQAYKSTDVTFNDVTIVNSYELALCVNASSVTATGTLTMDTNFVNVGWGSNISDVSSCSFDARTATLNGVILVYSDEGDIGNAANRPITIQLPSNWVETSTNSHAYVQAVATIGSTYYPTVLAAFASANDKDTIKLIADTEITGNTKETGTIEIPVGKNLTLDLNGKKLNSNQLTLTEGHVFRMSVKGSLTITDTSEKQDGELYSTAAANAGTPIEADGGTITLQSGSIKSKHDYGIAVFNGGSVIVNGGSISSEYAALSGNNTLGDMNFTITGGTLTAANGPAIYMPGQVALNISGGTLNGGVSLRMGQVNISGGTINAITENIDSPSQYYNYSGNAWLPDALYVFGGTYSDGDTEHGNSLNLNITGGTFNCSNGQGSAVAIYDLGKVKQDATIKISGTAKLATNASSRSAYQVLSLTDLGVENPAAGYNQNNLVGKVTSSITGGYFTTDPSAYCVENKTGVATGKADYPYTVGAKPDNSKPATVDSATVPANTTSTDPIVKDAAEKISGATLGNSNSIEAATKNEANNNKITADTPVGSSSTVLDSLRTIPSNSNIQSTDVAIVYQTYVDVTVTDAKKDSSSNSLTELTVDLTPMYRVVATTKSVAESTSTEIKLAGDGVTNANAIQIGEAKELNVPAQAYEVTLALPSGFARKDDKLSIKHTKENSSIEYYTGIVSTEGEEGSAKTYVTFTTNGFSPFVIYAASANVASIGDGANQKVYPTLQAAIDAVQDGQTIKLTKACAENVTVSRAVKFTLNNGGKGFTGSIAAGSRYSMTTSKTTSGNTEYTFTSVGGGSSSSISTPTTYAVNVNAATNGAVAADKKTASKGTTVTVTASPSKGYVVDAVKVVDKDGKDVAVTEKDGKYVFTMPASAVTVTGSFKAETPAPVALPFTDVKSGNWFYDAVKYAYAQGLMTGTSATTFAPNGTMNRAMIVTVLYRLEKSPAVTGASKFTDVPAGQWYSDAVAWAAANKIVNGYDETTFGPMNAVTREQMAAILFRYEQVKGLENVTLEENLNRFPDQNKISAYAIPALQWAVGQKIINGNADGTLDPTGTATRAQVAQIFTNLLNK